MCRVSVIIAAFNEENYIRRAIESIQSQTFQDFEILVCDDCSTDKTVDIVKEMVNHDNRIILLQNDFNMRAAASRNKCIFAAKGEFIAIQDADDYSDNTRLEEQIDFLENNLEYDFVSSRMYRFDENGIYSNLQFRKKIPENKDFLRGVPYAHAPTMFRKKALLNVNGYRDARETVRGQDTDLFMRLHAKGSKGYNLDETLYYYFEGKDAFKRKKFKHRIHNVIVRYKGYKALGLFPVGYIYMFKPLLVGIIPVRVLRWYKKTKG